ncbi:uncharacterized protein J3R85_015008 [Psidium guajava]|nr:uncharacterized protein J3R85_015008 [Psidium guajava]
MGWASDYTPDPFPTWAGIAMQNQHGLTTRFCEDTATLPVWAGCEQVRARRSSQIDRQVEGRIRPGKPHELVKLRPVLISSFRVCWLL